MIQRETPAMQAQPKPLGKNLRPFFDRLAERLLNDDPAYLLPHPLDKLCLLQFINAAHSYQRTLSPDGFVRHLLAAGVKQSVAVKVGGTYELGRQVLACKLHPWEKRQGTPKAKR
jgi:hypothetical protein